jgi:hypothetical protein
MGATLPTVGCMLNEIMFAAAAAEDRTAATRDISAGNL